MMERRSKGKQVLHDKVNSHDQPYQRGLVVCREKANSKGENLSESY